MNPPKTICTHPGCHAICQGGRCPKHPRKQWNHVQHDDRGSAASRGYGSKWTKASKAYRMANPLCVECLKYGITRPAECVDHIVPHNGDAGLMWDQDNWQSLCRRCHARKTARETEAKGAGGGSLQK